MSMTRPDGERIAVLETRLDEVLRYQAEMQRDISEMKEILQQAKGAKWVIVTAAALAGIIATYLPWFAKFIGLIKHG
jgi:hypothetical protein